MADDTSGGEREVVDLSALTEPDSVEVQKDAPGDAGPPPIEPAKEPTKDEPTPPPKDEGPTPKDLQEQITRLRIELAQSNGQNAILERLATGQQPEAPEEEVEEPVFTSDEEKELNELLRTNPLKAIRIAAQKEAVAAARAARKDMENHIETRTEMSEQKVFDQNRTVREFGHLIQGKDEACQEFRMLADSEYKRITKNGDWVPDSLYHASNVAFATLVRQGKIKVNGTSNGEMKPSTLRERTAPPRSMATSEASPQAEDQFPEEYTADDIARTKEMSAKFGVPVKSMIKEYRRQQKLNPGYGRGV